MLLSLWPTIGIDPGKSGSVVLLQNNELHVWKNFDGLIDIALAVRAAISSSIDALPRVVIEFVHSMPGQGVKSMFTFGRSTGVAMGAIMGFRPTMPFCEVSPQKWQNWYRSYIDIPTGAGSFDSTVIAPKVLTPEMLEKCKKPRGKLDHNVCDAALIAVWGANQLVEDLKPSEHWQHD